MRADGKVWFESSRERVVASAIGVEMALISEVIKFSTSLEYRSEERRAISVLSVKVKSSAFSVRTIRL